MRENQSGDEAMLPFPLTALYVEDNPETRELTQFFLENYFVEILSAKSGEEALEIFFKTSKIDIVITDLSLPGLDGFEMLRRMRKRREDLPIIIFTAYAETALMLQAIDLSVEGYLLKPFDPERFEAVIVSGAQSLMQRREKRRYCEELEMRLRDST